MSKKHYITKWLNETTNKDIHRVSIIPRKDGNFNIVDNFKEIENDVYDWCVINKTGLVINGSWSSSGFYDRGNYILDNVKKGDYIKL